MVYFSCLKHVNEMVLGDPWHAHQRTQSFHFALPHRHSANTRPCCSSAQAPSSLSTSLHALKHSTGSERVDALGRRAVEVIMIHMHDHSRFQRDIEWRHRRLSLSLSLSQKSLTHNIGSASALPIIKVCILTWTGVHWVRTQSFFEYLAWNFQFLINSLLPTANDAEWGHTYTVQLRRLKALADQLWTKAALKFGIHVLKMAA